MDKEYRKLIEDIKVQAENYANKEMLPVYADQKLALDKLNSLLGTLYIKHGVNGLLKVNFNDTGIKEALKTMGKQLGNSEIAKVTAILGIVYSDTYYKNVYTMNKGLKVALKFDILKKVNIDAAVNAKYKEELFSDRIWSNKALMIDNLQSKLIEATKGNTTIDVIGKQIKNIFNITAYESQRLVNTENARVQTQASYDEGMSTGVTQVMWSATLDDKTAPEDGELDGKVWDINEDHPEPPLHPNCRCCLINVPYQGWTPTQRKDNESKDLIDYTDYATWSKDNGIN